MIWTTPPTLEGLNATNQDTAASHLDLTFIEFGDDYLIAEMPVTSRSVQPMRMLHGGISCFIIETLGSVAGMLCVPKPGQQYIVGTEINASHLRGVSEGNTIFGKVTPVRIGRRVQVWQVDITNKAGRLICTGRINCQVLTM
jgi:1,4-dihydroxy-2-naphthoyl-CoA hydrolase